MSRKTIAVSVALGLAVAAGLVARTARKEAVASAAETETPGPVQVSVLTVAESVTPRWLTVTGAVQPQYSAPIATKVQGRVLRVLVREGDRVRKGQPLLELDARDLDAAISQAGANLRSAQVGYENARVAAGMEEGMAAARIAQARAAVTNAEAAVQAARARLNLVISGPRRQEKAQASLAVAQARAAMTLAQSNRDRMQRLFEQGAVSRQQLDVHQTQYDVAKAQYDSALEAESVAQEGSRQEDIRFARESVAQAEAGLNQARATLLEAKAAARQVDVRRAQIRGAAAQVGQGRAALEMARVTRDYATLRAPFDGTVAQRLADPGSLASPGVPLLVMEGGNLQLRAVVPESSLSAVRKGGVVPVSFDAAPGALSGTVAEIAPQGDPSSHTFTVKVNVASGSGVRSGMFGRARFAAGTSRQMLVPASAVIQREGLAYVYVVDDGYARMRLVTVGSAVGGRVPVLSGLSAGERIVADAKGIRDGAAVKARA